MTSEKNHQKRLKVVFWHKKGLWMDQKGRKKLQHYSQIIWQILKKSGLHWQCWQFVTNVITFIFDKCALLKLMTFFEQLGVDSLHHTDNVLYQHELFSRNVTTKWTQMDHVGPNMSLGVERIRYILIFSIMLYSSQRLRLLSAAK